jgi:SAM-dependent methyltransferase
VTAARGPFRTVWLPRAAAGASTEYWESAWAAEKHEALGPLVRAIDAALPSAGVVLESGCGQGEYVRLLARPGRPVVGVDLAQRALAAARHRHPQLALAAADVNRLPFADGTFAGLISLGVVEHFEGGPGPVLREQRRVLAPDGVLVITVPQRSWLRAATDTWHLVVRRRGAYQQRGRIVTRRRAAEPGPGPGAFHQYELTRRQLLAELADAGFRVERWQGFDPAAALGELPLPRRRAGGSIAQPPTAEPPTDRSPVDEERAPSPADAGPPTGGPRRGRRGPVGWLRAAALTDEPIGPGGRAVRALAGRALGHLQLVVARPA